MTRDDILSMSAGKELDELVAEKVMGWKRTGQCWKDDRGNTRTIELTSFGSFEPSQDISAAWEVVEKLKDGYQYFYTGWDYPTETYFAQFIEAIATDDEVGVELREINSISETAPLAICRAALLAVMEE